jgi:hypothetical protein
MCSILSCTVNLLPGTHTQHLSRRSPDTFLANSKLLEVKYLKSEKYVRSLDPLELGAFFRIEQDSTFEYSELVCKVLPLYPAMRCEDLGRDKR